MRPAVSSKSALIMRNPSRAKGMLLGWLSEIDSLPATAPVADHVQDSPGRPQPLSTVNVEIVAALALVDEWVSGPREQLAQSTFTEADGDDVRVPGCQHHITALGKTSAVVRKVTPRCFETIRPAHTGRDRGTFKPVDNQIRGARFLQQECQPGRVVRHRREVDEVPAEQRRSLLVAIERADEVSCAHHAHHGADERDARRYAPRNRPTGLTAERARGQSVQQPEDREHVPGIGRINALCCLIERA